MKQHQSNVNPPGRLSLVVCVQTRQYIYVIFSSCLYIYVLVEYLIYNYCVSVQSSFIIGTDNNIINQNIHG